MGPLFKLVGEICDKEKKKGSPLFVLCHKFNPQTYGEDVGFFYVVTNGCNKT